MLEGHGREDVGIALNVSRTVGWFTSVYPVVFDITGVDHLSDYIKEVKETMRKVPGHGIGYGMLRYQSGGDTLCCDGDILFNYLGQFDTSLGSSSEQEFEISSDAMGNTETSDTVQSHKLRVTAIIAGGTLQVDFSYSKNIFDYDLMHRLAQTFKLQLNNIIDHCLHQTPQLTPSDVLVTGLSARDLQSLFD